MKRLNHKGIVTGLEILLISFCGSLLAAWVSGIFVGYQTHKTLKKWNLVEYQQIQDSMGRLELADAN